MNYEIIALLTNIPTPYRMPFFRELSKKCKNNALQLLVFFDERSEPNRDWRFSKDEYAFDHFFLKNLRIKYQRRRKDTSLSDVRYIQIGLDTLVRLFKTKPKVVISAETGARTIQAAIYCKLTGAPLIVWWEGTEHSEFGIGRIKRTIRKIIFNVASRYWVNGYESANYLLNQGISREQIDDGMTGIDTKFFFDLAQESIARREELRNKIGVKGTVLIVVGALNSRKGIQPLLNAFDCLANLIVKEWSVVFVGRGPLESEVREWQAGNPDTKVILTGSLDPKEIPSYLVASDVFVMPTLDDVWGLAALESVLCGTPIVTSKYAGGTADLLVDPHIGITIDPMDRQHLADTLTKVINEPPPRIPRRLREDIGKHYGPEQMAQRAWNSLRHILGNSS